MNKNGTHNRDIGDDIVRLREEGKTYREIALILNCSKATINYHCKKHNLTDTGMKVHPIEPEIKKEIFEFSKSHTKKETMKEFNIGRTTVKRYKQK